MSTAKILEAFRGGMTAAAAVMEFGIRMNRASRLKEQIDKGEPTRKPGSGRVHTKIGEVEEIANLLLQGPDCISKHRLWTVASLYQTLCSLKLSLKLSLDTIRRRLNRSGLNLEFTAEQRESLKDHTEKKIPSGKRPVYLLTEQTELDLQKFVADIEHQGSDSFILHTLCAIDGHGKIRFRCHLEPVKPTDHADFLETLAKQYVQRFFVCGTRLEVEEINEVQSLLRDDVLLVKLDD